MICYIFGIIFCTCSLFSLAVCSDICGATDEILSCFTKILSYEAIEDLHRNLDGDKNGEVDHFETEKFLRKEFNSGDAAKKSRMLNSDDPLISLTDLWQMWRNNPAFNWTVRDTTQWLVSLVDLPQYVDLFRQHNLDGRSLPRLAMQNMSYLTDVLGIQNPIHKKKLMLRALDIILFGPPRQPVLVSGNVSLVTLSIGLLCVSFVGFSHWFYHASSFSEKNSVGENQKKLNVAEQTLKQLQKRLDDVEQLRQTLNAYEVNQHFASSSAPKSMKRDNLSSPHLKSMEALNEDSLNTHKQSYDHSSYIPSSVAEFSLSTDLYNDSLHPNSLNNYNIYSANDPLTFDQIRNLQCRKILNLKGRSSGNEFCSPVTLSTNPCNKYHLGEPYYELRHWLQVTYELELKRYCEKRMKAEKKLDFVRQSCRRFMRKRYGIFGSVRLVNAINLDELENRLISAKQALDQLESEVQERINRWSRIEALTGHLIRSDIHNQYAKSTICETTSSIPCSIDKYRYCNGSMKSSDSDRLSSMIEETSLESNRFPKSTGNGLVNDFDCTHNKEIFNLKESFQLNTETTDTFRTSLPRNYSFVRPFATLWRRKTKSGRGKSDSKQ
ncbi:Stromal interaction molecule, variant 2 [Schistosoma haematobium]|uniref:Stromal interaction molecule, variant 2 n=1 Tax=Schistosoma haematobium TaxID=6185 RepID=A0A922IMG7_SCHHA|nr:Stromal interaction molecule, variant 2 [Schistosoma haematobium]KAH9582927.1 Stromal interaction molecule, variant 2 [Schistosoma haematobium]